MQHFRILPLKINLVIGVIKSELEKNLTCCNMYMYAYSVFDKFLNDIQMDIFCKTSLMVRRNFLLTFTFKNKSSFMIPIGIYASHMQKDPLRFKNALRYKHSFYDIFYLRICKWLFKYYNVVSLSDMDYFKCIMDFEIIHGMWIQPIF